MLLLVQTWLVFTGSLFVLLASLIVLQTALRWAQARTSATRGLGRRPLRT